MKAMQENKFNFKYLSKQIKAKSYVSTMLFVGPKNVGKLQTALDFAKTIICEKEGDLYCGSCNECILLNSKNHPDLLFLDEEKNIKIDQIRDLQRKLYLKPYRAKNKIAIINNANFMTEEGANSFLKILEEPPKNSIIILISPAKDLLLETIVSRSQVIKFHSKESETQTNSENFEDDAKLIIDPPSLKEGFDIALKYSNNPEKIIPLFDTLEKVLRGALLRLHGFEGISIKKSENDIISKLDFLAEARILHKSNVNSRFLLENMIIRSYNG